MLERADLEAAYKGGRMNGGSYRQCAASKMPPEKIVGKLSKIGEDEHLVVVVCAPAKREGVGKKVAKYSDKLGGRLATAWAAKEAGEPYPVQAVAEVS